MLARYAVRRVPVSLLAATLTLLPLNAHGSQWAVGVAGGYANEYHNRTFTYDGDPYKEGVDGTGLVSLRILRDVGSHFSITSQASWLPFGNKFTRTDQVPIGVGIRYRVATPPKYDASPYIELSPSLVWSNWRGTDYLEVRGSFVQPGLIVGVGVQGKVVGRIGLDGGVRYFWSADAKKIPRGPTMSETLEGLGQTAISLGFYYSL
jgi:hypothetical protein